MRTHLSALEVARRRAQQYRDMLPATDQANDPDSLTQADLDLLLDATKTLEPSIEDLRINMVVKLRIYHDRYVDAITGRKRYMPDKTQQLVDDLTRGWDQFTITRPAAREPFPNMDRDWTHLHSDGEG